LPKHDPPQPRPESRKRPPGRDRRGGGQRRPPHRAGHRPLPPGPQRAPTADAGRLDPHRGRPRSLPPATLPGEAAVGSARVLNPRPKRRRVLRGLRLRAGGVRDRGRLVG